MNLMYFYRNTGSNDLECDTGTQTIWGKASENHLIYSGGVGVILGPAVAFLKRSILSVRRKRRATRVRNLSGL